MKRFLLAALVGICAVGAVACDEIAAGTVSTGEEAAAATLEAEETVGTVAGRAARSEVITEDVQNEAEAASTAAAEQTVTGDVVAVGTSAPDTDESFAYDDTNTITVTYYDMEEEREASTQYPVSDPADPHEVIDGVTRTLSEVLGNDRIEVQGATYSEGNLFVDFDASIYDLALTSADEHQVLDSIADTYLANVQGIRAVFFTVEGDPYSSEHTQLAEDEAYKTAA